MTACFIPAWCRMSDNKVLNLVRR